MQANASFQIVAMEKDVMTSDHLGDAKPIPWTKLCEMDGTMKHNADIFDKKGKKTGNIIFKTEFKWQEYIPPKPSDKLDKKSQLRIIIKEAQFEKDADMFGK